MRITLFSLLLIISLCLAQSCGFSADKSSENDNNSDSVEKSSNSGYAKFEFTKEIHKFGTITEGEIVVCQFYFKNTGDRNLIISHVESSCGCTEVRWDKKPLPPGEEGKISVEFNSQGRYGKQYKTVSIFANVPRKVKDLVIVADVK